MDVRRFAATLLVAPLLLLAGCGGHDSSVADPPISSPPTTSPPTTKPPQQETPEHFIRRWVQMYNSMQNTGGTRTFKDLSQGCKNCMALATKMERIYSSGGYVKTKGWEIRRIGVTDNSSTRPVVEIAVFSNVTTYRLSGHGTIKHFEPGTARFQFYLRPDSESWDVDKFNQLAS